MKNPFAELPTSVKKKKLSQLKSSLANGRPLEQFTRDERDLLHMETSEENVLYWKKENERAETDERCLHCQSITRSIITALRALDLPVEDDEKDDMLSGILTRADHAPLVLH